MGHGQKMVIFGITTSTLKQRIFQTDEGKKEAAATKLKGRLTITGWWLTYPLGWWHAQYMESIGKS